MSEPDNNHEIELHELAPGQRFQFRCHPGLSCFTHCCQQTTIILSPYDIIRLKRHLGITSSEFLERYTRREIDENTTLPLVALEMSGPEKRCPFVTAAGCGVYGDRPTTCRYYPVALGSMMTPQGMVECCAYLQEEHCLGFAEQTAWTVESWRANQELEAYDAGNRPWRTLMLSIPPDKVGKITDKIRESFYLAAYDLDCFRPLFLESPIVRFIPLGAEELARRVEDDEELMRLALQYLKVMLRVQNIREIDWGV